MCEKQITKAHRIDEYMKKQWLLFFFYEIENKT